MSSDIVGVFAYIFWFLAGVFLILSVYLFFKLRVKAIVDDLSGKKAAREIRAYREKHVYTTTDFLSAAMPVQGTAVLTEAATLPLNQGNETEKLGSNLILDEMVIHTVERI